MLLSLVFLTLISKKGHLDFYVHHKWWYYLLYHSDELAEKEKFGGGERTSSLTRASQQQKHQSVNLVTKLPYLPHKHVHKLS